MLAVFHRFPLLDPQLRKVGYGEYCEDQACAAALNIQTGANSAWTDYNRRLSAGGPLGSTDPTAEDSTVEFPPDGSSTSFTQFDSEANGPTRSVPVRVTNRRPDLHSASRPAHGSRPGSILTQSPPTA